MMRLYFGIGIFLLFLAYTAAIYKWAEANTLAGQSDAVIEVNKESKAGADETRKMEQSLENTQLDNVLCNLGIMRMRQGCQ